MDVSKKIDCAYVEENDLVSRYVGRKLDAADAEAFEEHYFGCERCWSEVKAATEVRAALNPLAGSTGSKAGPVIRGPWRKTYFLGAVAVAAALALVAILFPRVTGRPADETRSLVADLAEATGRQHSIHARLTGEFQYPVVRRSAGRRESAAPWKVFAEAEKIKQAAGRNHNARTAGALGLAHLVLGELDEAISRLEEATLLEPNNAGYHSDLAAAYLVLAERMNRPDGLVRALSEAETAIQLAPDLAEAHFNRALALERMSLKQRAKVAWNEYLRLDPDSEWAEEARRRLEALSAQKSGRWDDDRHRLIAARDQGDRTALRAVITRFPQQVREHFELELFPDWARVSVASQTGGSAQALGNLKILAEEHELATGDRLLTEATAAAFRVLQSSDRESMVALAEGLTHYRKGKELIDRLESTEALKEFESARVHLHRAGNPIGMWADFFRAICLYYQDDFENSAAECERLRQIAEERGYTNLRGRASWMTGLIHLVRGEVDQAVTGYEAALACFTETGEKGHQAAVHSLLATALTLLGDPTASWRHQLDALREIDLNDPRRAHRLYSNAAYAAMTEDLPLVALVLQDEALNTAPSWGSALILMEARLYRASIFAKLRREKEASDELARARKTLATIQDELIKIGEVAALDAVAGEIGSEARPEEARALLSRAADYFEGTNQRVRLPRIYLAHGRTLLNSGDPEGAEKDFIRGVEEFERQRELQGQFRSSFFEGSRELFEELIRLEAIQRRRSEAALGWAERLRQEGSRTSGERAVDYFNTTTLRAQLPDSTALLYFVSLSDRLLSWLITRDGIRFSQREIASGDLARRVAVFRKALEVGADIAELNRWSAAFHDDLVRPHYPFLSDYAELLVVPDGALQELPFAALYDRRSSRYLVQDHAMAMAPSVAAFTKGWSWKRKTADGRLSALAIGDPEFDQKSFPSLPPLPYAAAEARRVAEMYTGSELLLGNAATRRALLQAAERHDVLHFAGHAMANPEYPEFSRLVLAPQSQGDSGSLFARDISVQKLSRVRLVVLAACRSAQTTASRRDGPMNLVRPFLRAGVPQVLGTLWDIDDRLSNSFFIRFHEIARSGRIPWHALRETQLASLRSADASLRSPANWAVFVLYGSAGNSQERS